MVEEKQNTSYTNFVMLTENLYKLFIQYIIGGRLRAPPESDLVDLKSTFQKGAKTDRRALQSKFKSWAKRMVIDQNKLKLSFSGKEIIPQERCIGLVMHLHSEEHKSIDSVVLKIQERYTWTKKNFGMDRDMVLKLILENCSSPECKLQMEKEVSKRDCCENFIKSVILASEAHLKSVPENQNQIASSTSVNDSFFVNSSPIYAWPMVLPFPSHTTHNEYLFSYPLSDGNMSKSQSNIYIENEQQTYSPSIFERKIQECIEPNLQMSNKYYRITPKSEFNQPRSAFRNNGVVSKALRACRKPKHIIDFKNLLKAAEEESGTYPPILSHPKTKFLGTLELVPKRICSKKTLLAFEQEKKRKKKFEKMRLMCIMRRKNLRDRNKLYKIKIKQQQEKRAYLDVNTSRKAFLPQSEESFIDNSMCDSWQQGNGMTQKTVGYKDGCEKENARIADEDKEIEIINITSSEEETCDISTKPKSSETKQFSHCDSRERENLQRFKSSSISELKRKEAILSHYFRTGVNGLKGSERPSETTLDESANALHKIEMSGSHDSSNYIPLKEEFSQSLNIRPYLIPANIKGEIAIIPPSRFHRLTPIKPFPDFNVKVTENKPFSQVKKAFSTLEPIPKVLCQEGENIQEQLNLNLIPQLPNDTNTFLVEKTPGGVFTMIPYTLSNMPEVITPQNSVITNRPGVSQKKLTPLKYNLTSSSDKHRLKSISSTKNYLVTNPLQELNMNKKSIDEGMSKLSTFINKMKTDMVQVLFQHNIEKSAQRMEAQLNAGIALVKNIRKKLYQVEKLERLSRIVESENMQTEP